MRVIHLALVLAAAGCASATTVSYIDPFGAAGDSCSDTSCDVVGNRFWYDLDRLSLTVDSANQTASVVVVTNFGPNDNLAPFFDSGVRLDAADVLFRLGGNLAFGIPLYSHAGSPSGGPQGSTVQAGHLYGIQNSSGTLTAQQVLQAGDGYVYRRDQPVWLRDDGHGSVSDMGSGAVDVAVTGDRVTSGRLTIAVKFTPTADFVAAFNRGDLDVVFSSATCGNDILDGTYRSPSSIPEPGTVTLVFGALAAIGCRMRRRRFCASCGPAR
jgi:hypothetical protein